MASRSASFDYRQSVIGDCGHVCAAWPQFHTLGKSGVEIVCLQCTKERYGVDADAEVVVYVRLPEPEPKPTKPKKERKPSLTCSVCRKKGHLYTDCPLLVGQGDLFGT